MRKGLFVVLLANVGINFYCFLQLISKATYIMISEHRRRKVLNIAGTKVHNIRGQGGWGANFSLNVN